MESSLNCLQPGCWAVVTDVNTDEKTRSRLRDFGLIPGTRVTCRYKSPGGQVTALGFRGTVIALRTRELRKIRVRY